MEENDLHLQDDNEIAFLNTTSTQNHDAEQNTETSALLGTKDSPFEIVTDNVSNQDDPTLSCLTFRSIFLGLLFTCIFSFVNQFFIFRTLPIFLGMSIAQLLSYPLGKAMAAALPNRKFFQFSERWCFSLNPGPFSIKEHCVIATMANAASGTAMAIHVIVIQRLFYKHSLNNTLSLLFVISSQILGYGMAGIMRKFVVWPAAMIWPGSLADCALFRALHDNENNEEVNNDGSPTIPNRKTSRLRFFYLAVIFQFLWYWIPGYICPILSTFSMFCFINPSNVVLSQITGFNGLGLGSFVFDWNALASFLGSPITTPLWTQMNILVGFILIVWCIAPLVYYLNIWNTKTMPIVSNRIFTVEGYYYNVSAVLDSNLRLNETAYKLYGEMRITAIFAFHYGIGFAGITCVLVHTILYHGKSIVSRFRSTLSNTSNDIHGKLMAQYPEAPEWWYIILFIIAFITASIVCHFGQLMPLYMLFLAVIIAFIFLLPSGIMAALTNMMIDLNIFTEFLAGLILPGNPIANVTFKTYGYIAQFQALSFLYDLKFGHYMKIPPRIMFCTQIIATIVSGVINFLTALYLMNTIPDICTPKNIEWRCPSTVTFYSASIIWGVIGPLKMFGSKSIYWPLLLGFPIGALLPIPIWFLYKKYPEIKWLKHIHFPVMLSATSAIPPAPAGEYPSWLAVGFLFNFILFRYAHAWWKRYAFIFSAAMSCGVAMSALCIFFIFTSNNINFPTWWGSGGFTGDGCPMSVANFSGILPRYKP